MSKRQGGDKRPNAKYRRIYRERLFGAQDGMCAWCKSPLDSPQDGDLDRIVPGKDGGTYAIVNLVLSCRTCNLNHGIDLRHGRAIDRCHPVAEGATAHA